MTDIVERVWSLLNAGANAGAMRSPFTMLQAATLGLDGAPKVRTIVLRHVSTERSTLDFHTDARSEKVAQLIVDSRISLVGCDLDSGIQIRVEGNARLSDDVEEKMAVWNGSRPRSLIVYRAPLVPGTAVESPKAAYALPSEAQGSMAGFENFCLVTVDVRKIDYLDLSSPNGHERATFFREGEEWHGGWVAP
ncbi:hypothetical protein SAMN05444172_8455 [Burkholderia sp. GAS332]|nr:hypothetical protein SAMN05444172_8455 [Burkholderia sp. GAS332]